MIPRFLFAALWSTAVLSAAPHPSAAPGVTSLTNLKVRYEKSSEGHATLKHGGITAIIVDNGAHNLPGLPDHRAGYNGLASLTHAKQPKNLFVPPYAGLNFEHIHDGTTRHLKNKFEPRIFPMELRVIDQHTVELYQAPTGHWMLESCGRYRLLAEGVIEYTFECIPRRVNYANDYIGLFWASYIDQPESKAIHFPGRRSDEKPPGDWITATSPSHGVHSTHPNNFDENPAPVFDKSFPLTLANHPSPYRYRKPFYYGVSHGMAFTQIFRNKDNIWFAQSPSGGGNGNPAWDFQWFIRNPVANQAYGFVMRAAFQPYKSREQVAHSIADHLSALNPPKKQ